MTAFSNDRSTGALPLVSQRFPDDVIVAMHESGVTATCLPVRVDGSSDWRAALFLVAPAGSPCLDAAAAGCTSADGHPALGGGPFAVEFALDLHEHEHGSVFELAFDVATAPEPLSGELLFLTGHSSAHHEVLSLLTREPELTLCIGDEFCRLLWQQRVRLPAALRDGIRSLLDEAVRRDAVIRMTGRYDPDAAFAASLAGRRGEGQDVAQNVGRNVGTGIAPPTGPGTRH